MATVTITTWVASTAYTVGKVVLYGYQFYECVIAHTSSTFQEDYANQHYWVAIKGQKGDTGATGAQGFTGNDGDKGDKGDSGANGATGANGVFAAIASQAEAEAGTDNVKGMTALRVKQAIDAQTPAESEITSLQAVDAGLAVDIAAVSDRTSRLETMLTTSKYAGSQRILNNQVAPVAILGRHGENGRGDYMQVDASGTKHARFTVQIYRKDDVEERVLSITLILLYIGTTWYLGREKTTQLIGAMDGLTFSIQQVDDYAQVYYTSDNMSGGNYSNNSRISYMGEEIAIGV